MSPGSPSVLDLSWHAESQASYSVVAIAASAGAFAVFCGILGGLSRDFPVPVLLVQHRGAGYGEQLLELLSCRTRLRVRGMQEGDRPQPGTLHVALGGRHVTVDAAGAVAIGRGRTYGKPCPSCDQLLESVAAFYGPHAIAVLLSGDGRDGALGATAIRKRGGFVIAQDPSTSRYEGMPSTAVETRKVDLVLPPDQIAFALTTLTSEPVAA